MRENFFGIELTSFFLFLFSFLNCRGCRLWLEEGRWAKAADSLPAWTDANWAARQQRRAAAAAAAARPAPVIIISWREAIDLYFNCLWAAAVPPARRAAPVVPSPELANARAREWPARPIPINAPVSPLQVHTRLMVLNKKSWASTLLFVMIGISR